MTNDVTDLLPALQAAAIPGPMELGNLSNQELRSRLAQSLSLSAKHLAYLAAVWGELEKRGEDLSDLRSGLTAYLPQIAAGRLDAEVVVKFAGQPTVLQSLAQLSLDKQRSIVRGEPIEVLTVNAAGEYEVTKTPAYMLSASQARLVFSAGKVRTPDEQKTTFESARIAAMRRTRPGPDGRVRYDPRTDQIRIGKSAASVGEVVAAIMVTPVIDDDAELVKSIVIKMTESDHRVIKIRAAEAGLTQEVYVRGILKKFSLL